MLARPSYSVCLRYAMFCLHLPPLEALLFHPLSFFFLPFLLSTFRLSLQSWLSMLFNYYSVPSHESTCNQLNTQQMQS
ncbi:hypothetical protein V8C37DRAFT_371482 [Trichoderma ceciliae]